MPRAGQNGGWITDAPLHHGDEPDFVSDLDRLSRIIRSKIRSAGRTVGQAERAFRTGRQTATIPTTETGEARIVCRRYAERRAVEIDEEGRPHCFDASHRDCQGCREDIQNGLIETWDPGAEGSGEDTG